VGIRLEKCGVLVAAVETSVFCFHVLTTSLMSLFIEVTDYCWLAEERNFFFSFHTSRKAPGLTHPPIQWAPGLKWPGRDANHSPSSNAEVKNGWSYATTRPLFHHDGGSDDCIFF